jgi:hypothetical protein
MDKPILRTLIQEKLTEGRLPHDHVLRIWSCPGNRETCDACGETVTKAQTLMKGLDARGSWVQLHDACFYLWNVERQVPGHERSGPARSPSPTISSRDHT